MPKLEILLLRGNNIDRFGADVFGVYLTAIEVLDLRHNELDIRPIEFVAFIRKISISCPQIKKLFINHNPCVQGFPAYYAFVIKELQHLEQLDDFIRSSNIVLTTTTTTTVPDYLWKCEKLQLSFKTSEIRALSVEAGGYLGNWISIWDIGHYDSRYTKTLARGQEDDGEILSQELYLDYGEERSMYKFLIQYLIDAQSNPQLVKDISTYKKFLASCHLMTQTFEQFCDLTKPSSIARVREEMDAGLRYLENFCLQNNTCEGIELIYKGLISIIKIHSIGDLISRVLNQLMQSSSLISKSIGLAACEILLTDFKKSSDEEGDLLLAVSICNNICYLIDGRNGPGQYILLEGLMNHLSLFIQLEKKAQISASIAFVIIQVLKKKTMNAALLIETYCGPQFFSKIILWLIKDQKLDLNYIIRTAKALLVVEGVGTKSSATTRVAAARPANLAYSFLFIYHLSICGLCIKYGSRAVTDYLISTQFHSNYLYDWLRTSFKGTDDEFTARGVGGVGGVVSPSRQKTVAGGLPTSTSRTHDSSPHSPLESICHSEVLRCLTSLILKATPSVAEQILQSTRIDDILLRIIFRQNYGVRCLAQALEGVDNLLRSGISNIQNVGEDGNKNYLIKKLILENQGSLIDDLLSDRSLDSLMSSSHEIEALEVAWLFNRFNGNDLNAARQLTTSTPKLSAGGGALFDSANLRNQDVIAVYINLLNIILYCVENSDSDSYCKQAVGIFLKNKGALKILNTCSIPDALVRGKALKCLSTISLNVFESNELKKLLWVSSKFSDLETYNTLDHLYSYFLIWSNIVQAGVAGAAGGSGGEGGGSGQQRSGNGGGGGETTPTSLMTGAHCGKLWRTEFAESLVDVCIDKYEICVRGKILVESSERESRRLEICCTIADIIRQTGAVRELRSILQDRLHRFKKLLIYEDSTSLSAPQTFLERTAVFRDLNVLTDLLVTLKSNRKMAFRLMLRIADILGGFKDTLYICDGEHRRLQTLVFDEPRLEIVEIRRAFEINWNYLDPDELREFHSSFQKFLKTNGMEKLHSYIVSNMISPGDTHQLKEFKKNLEDVNYWVGRLKGQIIDAEEILLSPAAGKSPAKVVAAAGCVGQQEKMTAVSTVGIIDEIPDSTDPVLRSQSHYLMESEDSKHGSTDEISTVYEMFHKIQGYTASGIDTEKHRVISNAKFSVTSSSGQEMRPAFIVHAYLRAVYFIMMHTDKTSASAITGSAAAGTAAASAAATFYLQSENIRPLFSMLDFAGLDLSLLAKTASLINVMISKQLNALVSMDHLAAFCLFHYWIHSMGTSMINLFDETAGGGGGGGGSRSAGFYYNALDGLITTGYEILLILRSVINQLHYMKFSNYKVIRDQALTKVIDRIVTYKHLAIISSVFACYSRLSGHLGKIDSRLMSKFENASTICVDIVTLLSHVNNTWAAKSHNSLFTDILKNRTNLRRSMLSYLITKTILIRLRTKLELQYSKANNRVERFLSFTPAWLLDGTLCIIAHSHYGFYKFQSYQPFSLIEFHGWDELSRLINGFPCSNSFGLSWNDGGGEELIFVSRKDEARDILTDARRLTEVLCQRSVDRLNDIVLREHMKRVLQMNINVAHNPALVKINGELYFLLQAESRIFFLYTNSPSDWFTTGIEPLDSDEKAWATTGESADALMMISNTNNDGLANFISVTATSAYEKQHLQKLQVLHAQDYDSQAQILKLLPEWAVSVNDNTQAQKEREKFLDRVENCQLCTFELSVPTKLLIEVVDPSGDEPVLILTFNKKRGGAESVTGNRKLLKGAGTVELEFFDHLCRDRWKMGLTADLRSSPEHWKQFEHNETKTS